MRVLETVSNRLDEAFPIGEDLADLHAKLGSLMALGSLVAIEKTIEQVDRHKVADHSVVFTSKVALAGFTLSAMGFFYDRFWKSQGE